MSNNLTVTFPGDGFVNVSSVDVFPPVWGSAASIGNSVFYLVLFAVYFICFGILLRVIRKRQDLQNRKGVMKRNHIIMFILAGLMVAIQSLNLLIRLVDDILLIEARLIVERNERITFAHYAMIWIVACFSTFFMFLNYIMLFVILFFVQMVFWRTAATMRAISKKVFKGVRIFTQATIVLFVLAAFVILILLTLSVPLLKFDFITKATSNTVNYIMLAIIVLLYSKDTIAILLSGILVIKTIRKSITKIKNATTQHKKMENPFIVTFSLLISLISCILLQFLAVLVAAVLVSDREDLKFVWHFINCAGILLFAILTLALFYPMFIQTESVFKELHMDDSKSTGSNVSDSRRNETNRNSIFIPVPTEKNFAVLSPSDVTLLNIPTGNSGTTTSSALSTPVEGLSNVVIEHTEE